MTYAEEKEEQRKEILRDLIENRQFEKKSNELEFRPYREEVVSDDIKYIKDTLENRKILEKKFGKHSDMFGLYDNQFSYIRFNTQTKEWTPSLDFEWLYRNPPILTPIEEIIK